MPVNQRVPVSCARCARDAAGLLMLSDLAGSGAAARGVCLSQGCDARIDITAGHGLRAAAAQESLRAPGSFGVLAGAAVPVL